MSKNAKLASRVDLGFVEVKSKFCAEFRRFSVDRSASPKFEEFEQLLVNLHGLKGEEIVICYTDPEGDLLPINNNDNYNRALMTAKPLLRILVQRKGESYGEVIGYGTLQKKKGPISKLISSEPKAGPHTQISMPQDFRRVSAIIDVDVVPESHRRVKLMKNGSDKPLGFYIRDGTSVRVTAQGLEKVPGIFISRLVPGGLAESTGLLAVNDEVLEVNGIEVTGKTLDQVTDMMVANSANLIITVKPVNQRNNISPKRNVTARGQFSQNSTGSLQSSRSALSYDSDEIREHIQEEDEDEVQEHLTDKTKQKSASSTPAGTPDVARHAKKNDANSIMDATKSTTANNSCPPKAADGDRVRTAEAECETSVLDNAEVTL